MLARTLSAFLVLSAAAVAADTPKIEYRLLATTRTSTMQKEMSAAAAEGFVYSASMGGESAFGGKEVLVVMARDASEKPARQYRLLATSKTSTMQKEMQAAADEGFRYCGQTVFETGTVGSEVVVIMERDPASVEPPGQYLLLSTKRTSTMQKELEQAGSEGFRLLGLTVGETAFGGKEVVSILARPAAK